VSNFNKIFASETSLAKKVERDSPMLDLKLNNSFVSSDGGKDNYLLNPEHNKEEDHDYIYQPNKNLLQLDYVEQTKLLLRQYDMMIQLLIQNMLLTDQAELKLKCYTMLYSYYLARSKVLACYKLPQYEISFKFCEVKLN
jgi:hypothetical protein